MSNGGRPRGESSDDHIDLILPRDLLPPTGDLPRRIYVSGKPELAYREFLRILEKNPNDMGTLGSLEQFYSDTSHSIETADIQRTFSASSVVDNRAMHSLS